MNKNLQLLVAGLLLVASDGLAQPGPPVDPLPLNLTEALLQEETERRIILDRIVDWLESTGVFVAQVQFALENEHKLTHESGLDRLIRTHADYFHFHVLMVGSGPRIGTFLGILGHANEYNGQRSNDPNNFNIFTSVGGCVPGGCLTEYVPSPGGPTDLDGLWFSTDEGMPLGEGFLPGPVSDLLKDKGLLAEDERAGGGIQVQFRVVHGPRDPNFPEPEELERLCGDGERLIGVPFGNRVIFLCYRVDFHVMSESLKVKRF